MEGKVITYEELQKRKKEKEWEAMRKEEEERTPDGDLKLVLGEE